MFETNVLMFLCVNGWFRLKLLSIPQDIQQQLLQNALKKKMQL